MQRKQTRSLTVRSAALELVGPLFVSKLDRSPKVLGPESIPPLCPNCSRQMEFERTVEAEYGRHEVVTYRCSPCSVWFTFRVQEAFETSQTVKDNLRRVHAKKARKVVSRKLALYHRSLIEHLSKDSPSLFDRVMEQARRNHEV